MRRVGVLILCMLSGISLSACSAGNKAQMYIQEAQLTEAEKNMVQLLGGNQEHYLYDFQSGHDVKSVRINTYEWIDGDWHIVAGDAGLTVDASKGRLALGFHQLSDGLEMSIQSGNGHDSTSYFKDQKNPVAGMGHATSALSEKRNIVYEQEIPLVIQHISPKDEVVSCDVDDFFQPEKYEKRDDEHIYAVTALFSSKELGE